MGRTSLTKSTAEAARAAVLARVTRRHTTTKNAALKPKRHDIRCLLYHTKTPSVRPPAADPLGSTQSRVSASVRYRVTRRTVRLITRMTAPTYDAPGGLSAPFERVSSRASGVRRLK